MAKSGGKRVPISYHRQMELAKNPGERYGEAFEAKRNRLFTEVNETQGNVLRSCAAVSGGRPRWTRR